MLKYAFLCYHCVTLIHLIMTAKPTFRFVFNRRKTATSSRDKNKKTASVEIVVTYERKRKVFGTGIKLYTDQWRENDEEHVIRTAYAHQYNEQLKRIMGQIMERANELLNNGTFSLDALTMGKDDSELTLLEYGQRFVDGIVGCSKATLKEYHAKLHGIERFGKFGQIGKVTLSDIEAFDKWMAAQGLKASTRVFRLSFIGTLLKDAHRHGIIKSNPYGLFKLPKRSSVERTHLSEEQIAQIVQADLPANLHIARDLFLIQCYTGMAYIDTQTLTPDMIVRGGSDYYIQRSRTKTQVHYRIMVLPMVLDILKRHGMSAPKIDKFVYNRHLKKIGSLAGLPCKLSSHVGRHTFATWALSKGVPIEIVSKMLGHTNIQTTQIYAKILAKDVDMQFKRLAQMMG